MSDIDAFRQQTPAPEVRRPPVAGIGGWLILPMLGLIISPFVVLYLLSSTPETLASLQYLNAGQATLAVVEIIGNVAIGVLAPIALLIMFFRKLRVFKSWYIGFLAANAVYVLLDLAIGYALFADLYRATGTQFFDRDTARTVSSSIFGVLIWIPYMLNSERVKNTFVN